MFDVEEESKYFILMFDDTSAYRLGKMLPSKIKNSRQGYWAAVDCFDLPLSKPFDHPPEASFSRKKGRQNGREPNVALTEVCFQALLKKACGGCRNVSDNDRSMPSSSLILLLMTSALIACASYLPVFIHPPVRTTQFTIFKAL